ncbi:MAG: hypothetical protein HZB16_21260 [Armatimonadetes bacterium]|nr:hypothetical protein [Armatimonadota bacterium]
MWALLAVILLATPPKAPEPPEALLRAAFVAGSPRLDGAIEVFTGEHIYEYMDGAGELPVACGYRQLAAARLVDAAGRKLTAELILCPGPAEAFGIYSLRRQPGEAIVPLSHLARHLDGELIGWRGPYFWVVSSLAQPAPSQDDLLATAKLIEARIPDAGALPDLLGRLPIADLKPDSARYCHGKFGLDTFWFRRDNLLGLPLPSDGRPVDVEVAAARYEKPVGQLIVAHYPSVELAAAAHARWAAAKEAHELAVLDGAWLGLVVDAASEADAAVLAERLKATMAKPGPAWTEG